MQDVGYAALQIIPSFQGFQGNLEKGSSGALVAAGRTGGGRFGDSAGRSAGSRFGSVFKSTIAALGLFQLARTGIDFLQDSVAEARESQKVGAITAQVIKSTGGAAQVTAKQVGDLSTALSLKTGVDDEVIQRGANMLLTFKDIRNEVGKNNDIFNQSVAITEDMAAAMAGGQGGNGLDLKSSSILVGKALNDPVKGLTALTRVGVSFTDQQKTQIQSLVDQNDKLGAQKIILGELKSEFGGTARAQATMGEKVSVAWSNIQEKLGTALLPLIHDVEKAFLREGIPALNRFSDWFGQSGAPAIRGFVDDAKPLVHSLLPAAATVFDDLKGAAKAALPFVKGTIDAFNNMPDWAQKAIAVGGAGAIVGGKLGLGSLLTGSKGGGGGLLGGVISRSAPVPVVIVKDLSDGPGGTGTGKSGFLAFLSKWLGPAAVPAAGGALVHHFTPESDLPTNPAPAASGGGLSVPNFWRTDDLKVQLGDIAKDLNPKDWNWSLPDDLFGSVDKAKSDFHLWYEEMLQGNRQVTGSTRDLIAGTSKFGHAIDGLPKQLVTKFLAPGLIENRGDANRLVKQYDLTPKQKQTLFKVLGIPQAQNATKSLIGTLTQAAQPRHGSFDIDTSSAQYKADHLLATLNNINRLQGMNAAGVGPPAPSGGSSRMAPRRRAPRTMTLQAGGRDMTVYVDERIATNADLADERNRAGVR